MAEYSDQIRAQALAQLLTGQSFSEVSRALGVPIGTLKKLEVTIGRFPGCTGCIHCNHKKGTHRQPDY